MIEPENQDLTEEQMNQRVVEDVNDPSAWGDPIVVGASKGPRRRERAKNREDSDPPC
jgi:hypothetical protein